jgi:Domain of unknown function (DUF929)
MSKTNPRGAGAPQPKGNRGVAPRRSQLWLLVGVVAIVVVAALVVAVVSNSNGSSSSDNTAATNSPAEAAAVVKTLAAVPAAVLQQVGLGTGQAPQSVSGTAIAVDGKPEVLYVGAEFCPFCAAERWPLFVAMSRFGTFADVGITHSSGSDVYPNTPTLAFHGSTYTSDYLAFTPVETKTNQPDGSGGYTDLDTLTAEQEAIVKELSPGGGIPFVDLGGRFLISGASYDPGLLKGLSAQQIADELSSPSSDVAKAVLGTANAITAALCELTNKQPAAVCTT